MTDSYDSLILVETAEKIYIHSSTLGAVDEFIINRTNCEITISAADQGVIPYVDCIRTIPIWGIIGVINLIAGPYLVVIKSRVKVGEISTHVIWQLEDFEVIPFKKSLQLSKQQVQYNNTYLDMINSVLMTPNFYYSHTFDLSLNLQALSLASPDFLQPQSLMQCAEPRFVWNNHLLQMLRERTEFQKFCVSIIQGSISISTAEVNSKQFKFLLISRRCSKRPGTRLFSRGIDSHGNVSNFVETEQIVDFNGDISSFVQIRGSIPLFWTQKPDLRYKSKPTLVQIDQNEAFRKHFDELIMKYGKVVCVDLVDQTGSESVLETAFSHQVEISGNQKIRYEPFDFHHECRNMNWHRTEILMSRLANEIEEFGYFSQSRGQKELQNGVFRTNCIDCLDRTNVVQGLLGKRNIEQVLQTLGILKNSERIANHRDFKYLFNNAWADNGDVCSIEYSGTGALKTDFTRTGKRTFMGIMSDGYNAISRYLKNNFKDGYRQDAMNVFLGNWKINEAEGSSGSSPLEKHRGWKYCTLPFVFIVSTVKWTSLVVFPREYSKKYFLSALFWGSMVFSSGGTILYYGTEFVDSPVLPEPVLS